MTETKRQRESESRYHRNEFGKCLQDIMFSRDIFTASDLARELNDDGDEPIITDRLIRQNWSGTSRPSTALMRRLEAKLDLTLLERARLSTSVFYDDWRDL